jgi:hypothetical protein
MKVRVCGPNLSSVAQKRATFHVHADGCRDLSKYGPYKVMGGDRPGDEETLLDVDSQLEAVHIVYSDQIDEAVNDIRGQTRDDIASDYISDFWFASCCAHLPVDAPEKPVYECWVTDDPPSFAKLASHGEIIAWLQHRLVNGVPMHKGIHIVKHDKKEYTS